MDNKIREELLILSKAMYELKKEVTSLRNLTDTNRWITNLIIGNFNKRQADYAIECWRPSEDKKL